MSSEQAGPFIGRAVLSGGTVTVLAPADTGADDICLAVGETELPFSPLRDVAPDDPRFAFPASFEMDVGRFAVEAGATAAGAGPRDGRICSVSIDALETWSLAGSPTLQVQVRERTVPFTVVHGDPVRLPPSHEGYVFTAAAAVHRGEAEVILRLEPEHGGPAEILRAPVDPSKGGGRLLGNFDRISIPVPPRGEARRATLAIAFRRSTAQPTEAAPHVFFARPEIARRGAEAGPLSPIRVTGRPVAHGKWLRAGFSPYDVRPGMRIVLRAPGQEIELMTAQDTLVELVRETGTALHLRASREGAFALYLDGRPVRTVTLGPGAKPVRLPPELLTGAPVHVSLRDVSGSQVFLETYALPLRTSGLAETIRGAARPPFPGELFAAAAHRYDALKRHLAAGIDAGGAAQLARALAALEAGPEHLEIAPLSLPAPPDPEVSVVVCAHDRLKTTYACLCALLLARCETSFEVILVDDGSTDGTRRIEEIAGGARVVRLQGPKGFLAAANAGAAEARGRYLAFLNNDTEPTAGWLDALRDAFDRFENVGLAGARLLWPDGRVQDAGGIVRRSGDPAHPGRGASPLDPRYRYARQADYVSGAAMMTPRSLWERLGGFDTAFSPMYFEDTDYAFRVRETGLNCWAIPAATVFHVEGATAGTDVAEGPKRHQETNRPVFKRRWASAFAAQPAADTDPDLARDRGVAGRILCLDYTTPRPDIDAGGHAGRQEMRLLGALGYKVTFLPHDLEHAGTYTDALERDGIECLTAPFVSSVEDALESRGHEFDAVYVTRYQTGRLIPAIRQHAPQAKVILNLADLHFLRELRGGIAAGDPARIAAAERTRDEELSIIGQADAVLSYTETERAVIDSHLSGRVPARACPWVVEPRAPLPPREGRSGLSFLGNYGHRPNVEGVAWFARTVMPRLEAEVPEAHLAIYGSKMGEEVRALAGPRVEAVGHVPRLADIFDPHLVFVAPLRFGAGIKGKVLDAMAHGVPVVVSPVAAEGIALAHGRHALVAETVEDWVEAVRSLHADADLWHRLSEGGQALVRERFGFGRGLATMRAALEAVDLYAPDPGAGPAPAPAHAEDPAPSFSGERSGSHHPAPAVPRGGEGRTVVLHHHLFKCAGTSLDAVLERNFPGRVAKAEFEHRTGDLREAAARWIANTPEAVAFSSHTLTGPLPELPGVTLLPVMLFRDPIERIRSAWRFERTQQADTLGARLAREHDFAGYVRARLDAEGDRQCRNFQTGRLAGLVPGDAPEIERAEAALDLLAVAGLVARFEETLERLGARLAPVFPDFDPAPEHLNRDAGGPIEGEALPEDLAELLRAANADDLHLLQLVERRWAAG